jgi:hypothetical protein
MAESEGSRARLFSLLRRATPRSLGRASLGAFCLASTACSSRQATPVGPIDCAAADAPYDFLILESYDEVPPHYGWYGYADNTPGGSWVGEANIPAEPPVIPIEDGGPCSPSLPSGASQSALFLSGQGYQDYGNGWGTYNIGVYYPNVAAGPQTEQPDGAPCVYNNGDAGVCPIDGAGYDGLTFWARSYDPTGNPTTKGFTITINDKESGSGVDSTCVPYDAGTLANGSTIYTTTGAAMGNTGGSVASAVPPANACGNGFARPLLTTDQWQLYTLPFSSFYQSALPNRISTGFDASSFFQLLVAAPKEAHSALWIDSMGFYRAKGSETVSEAGP